MARQLSEESVPVQELKTPTIVSIRRFVKSVLVVLLSFCCIFVGMLIYQLHTPLEDFQTTQPAERKNLSPVVRRIPTNSVSPIFRQLPAPKQEIVEKVKESVPEEVKLPENPPSKKTENVPEVKTESIAPPVLEKVKNEEPPVPVLPLKKALELRDHLALGMPCLADLKMVMKYRLPDDQKRNEIIDRLMPICTAHSVYEELENLFYKNKKAALMTYYRLNNPIWLAYLKTLGTLLVDVRRIHPLKQKPKDIISLAQNALMVKNVGMTVSYIQKLSPEVKADFREFLELAASYTSAQKTVDQIVLSFGKKGE